MTLIGRTLGYYRIVEPLGAGGMGEVYRAHDEKLDRDVALKVLPEGALADEEARKRFRREANALSRLSHPHVATLFDFDTEDGTDFLVMELVSGPSLRDTLEGELLPEQKLVALGTQLARGLQAAHEKGIVHRDLKPSNLMLTPDGLLKILDFGLARLVPRPSPSGEPAATQTAVGKVAGTLPYMSPEQLRGRGVDERTDLYAAGAVLYEMATGKRLFSKPSPAELTGAILHEDPTPPREVNDRVSPGLEQLILKALDKDPDLRHQTAKDLLVDLERLQQRSSSPSLGSGRAAPPARRPRSTRPGLRWGLSAAAVSAILAGAAWVLWPPPSPRIGEVRPLRLDVGPAFRGSHWVTWATDGLRVYYVVRREGQYRLYHVALSGGEPAEIPTPFGDGLEVYAYLRQHSALIVLGGPPGESGRVKVWLLPLPRGAPRPVGTLAANFIAVSPDEEQLAMSLWEGDRSRIVVVPLDDPVAPPLAEVRVASRAFALRWGPDGQRLRFTAGAPGRNEPGTWVWETSTAGEEPRPLWPGEGGAWTGDGSHFVFERQDWAARRNDVYVVPDRPWPPWVRREPAPLTNGPIGFSELGTQGDGSGLLAFGRLSRAELQRFDRQSGRFERLFGGESLGMLRPSPDGRWVTWVAYPEGTLWRSRPDGTERLQLTDAPLSALKPVWSPDGSLIAFVGVSWTWSIRMVPADGGPVETLAEPAPGGGSGYGDPCWLPDGALLFSHLDGARPGVLRFDLARRTTTPLPGAEEVLYPRCGPQGQLLAYRPSAGTRLSAWLVRRAESDEWEDPGLGLSHPAWTRDGRSVCGLADREKRIACYSFDAGRLEYLADIDDEPLLNWPFFPWMGLDAENNPLVVFDRSTRDLYALDWEAP